MMVMASGIFLLENTHKWPEELDDEVSTPLGQSSSSPATSCRVYVDILICPVADDIGDRAQRNDAGYAKSPCITVPPDLQYDLEPTSSRSLAGGGDDQAEFLGKCHSKNGAGTAASDRTGKSRYSLNLFGLVLG